jgi:hypothetical protein
MSRPKAGTRAAAEQECARANAAVRRLRRCRACKGGGHYTIVIKGQCVVGSSPCRACGGSGAR